MSGITEAEINDAMNEVFSGALGTRGTDTTDSNVSVMSQSYCPLHSSQSHEKECEEADEAADKVEEEDDDLHENEALEAFIRTMSNIVQGILQSDKLDLIKSVDPVDKIKAMACLLVAEKMSRNFGVRVEYVDDDDKDDIRRLVPEDAQPDIIFKVIFPEAELDQDKTFRCAHNGITSAEDITYVYACLSERMFLKYGFRLAMISQDIVRELSAQDAFPAEAADVARLATQNNERTPTLSYLTNERRSYLTNERRVALCKTIAESASREFNLPVRHVEESDPDFLNALLFNSSFHDFIFGIEFDSKDDETAKLGRRRRIIEGVMQNNRRFSVVAHMTDAEHAEHGALIMGRVALFIHNRLTADMNSG